MMHKHVSDVFKFQTALKPFEIKCGLPLMSVSFELRPSRAFKSLKLQDWLLSSMVSLMKPSRWRKNPHVDE